MSPLTKRKRELVVQRKRGRDAQYKVRQALGLVSVRGVDVHLKKLGDKLYNLPEPKLLSLADMDDPAKVMAALQQYLNQWIES